MVTAISENLKRSETEHQDFVDNKRRKRMSQVDELPSEIRALVHTYGLNAVRALLDAGVRKPNQIRHIIETVLDEFSPTRGTFSSQGIQTPTIHPGATAPKPET